MLKWVQVDTTAYVADAPGTGERYYIDRYGPKDGGRCYYIVSRADDASSAVRWLVGDDYSVRGAKGIAQRDADARLGDAPCETLGA